MERVNTWTFSYDEWRCHYYFQIWVKKKFFSVTILEANKQKSKARKVGAGNRGKDRAILRPVRFRSCSWRRGQMFVHYWKIPREAFTLAWILIAITFWEKIVLRKRREKLKTKTNKKEKQDKWKVMKTWQSETRVNRYVIKFKQLSPCLVLYLRLATIKFLLELRGGGEGVREVEGDLCSCEIA